MADLVLEFYSEEIPAGMQAPAEAELERKFADFLTSLGVTEAALETHSAPQRLTLLGRNLPTELAEQKEEKKGPRTDAPEKAIEGFLKANGRTDTKGLAVREDPKGAYYVIEDVIPGRDLGGALAAFVPELVRGFNWPKSMRWGAGTLRWVRPLRAILCRFNGQVLSFEVDGLSSGGVSHGHRFMAPEALEIENADTYLAQLEQACVIADREKRQALVQEKAAALAAAEGLELVRDAALFSEVAGLVEWPVPLLGRIDEKFMDVPEEVLISVMRTHQKYLALRDGKGRLAPRFIAIANMETKDGGAKIIVGNERVLRARLSDAGFFWDEDRKTPLSERLEALEKVTFHAKLGTVRDKTARIEKLMGHFADVERDFAFDDLSAPADLSGPDSAGFRAAALCKADLVTGMVCEFPELQGIMGGHYAALQLDESKVGAAIRDHYKPLGPNDDVPATAEGRLVAMADKMDTLAGFWLINEPPTGSKDPYALRRASLGIVRILIEGRRRLSLDAFIGAAIQGYPAQLADLSVAEKLRLFFIDRLKIHLRGQKDIRPDVVDAVLAVSVEAYRDDVYVLSLMAEALKAFLDSENGVNLLAAYRRVKGILKKSSPDGADVDETLFASDEERGFHAALGRLKPGGVSSPSDYRQTLEGLAALRDSVDRFFDHVLVEDENEKIRQNRLALVNRLITAMDSAADFSLIE